jgi:hypothetical protein
MPMKYPSPGANVTIATATTTAMTTATAPTPTCIGEYRGFTYYEFAGLRGYWNSTMGTAALYAGPCGRVKAPLTPAEAAALEAAAAAANL